MKVICSLTVLLAVSLTEGLSLAHAEDKASPLAAAALNECERGRLARDRAARLTHFEAGQRLGERAVQADDRLAEAHFSLFCNLGEQMRIDGETSVASVLGFRRMLRELDRTLELAPDHLGALSARGTLLVRLPRLLGGDLEKGQTILRQVIEREPTAINARLSLARAYSARGKHDLALSLASEAVKLARTHPRHPFLSEAERLVSELWSTTVQGH